MIKKINQDYRNITKQLSNLHSKILIMNNFLKKYEKICTKKESIDALRKIRKYLEIKVLEEKQMQNNLNLLKRQIKDVCSHSVIVKFGSRRNCPCCNDQFDDLPNNALYEIETNNFFDFDAIIDFFEKFFQNNDMVDEVLLEEIEYSYDVKVRRLKNEKKRNYRNA